MSFKELTIIHHPTNYEFFLNDEPITINRKTYYRHIFRYQRVKLVTFVDDFYQIPLRIPLFIRLLSRKKASIQSAKGEEKAITIPELVVFLFMFVKRSIGLFVKNFYAGVRKRLSTLYAILNKWSTVKNNGMELKKYLSLKCTLMYYALTYRLFKYLKMTAEIKNFTSSGVSDIEEYWSEHTVNSLPFITKAQSVKQLDWRFSIYPLYKEYMELYDDHSGQVIMDYGCGPGADLTGFALYSNAQKIIGVDVSPKALQLAQHRLALHRIDPDSVKLYLVSDEPSAIPIEDSSLDHIYCEGVLHHTSHPDRILQEFHRILKPGSKACIMVYNHDSIFLHLTCAYIFNILNGWYPGATAEEVFSRVSDGENCPKVLQYRSVDFIPICNDAGFDSIDYLGGFYNIEELRLLTEYKDKALQDTRLGEVHKEFLCNLEDDVRGYPMYKGKTAGCGGVYNLYK